MVRASVFLVLPFGLWLPLAAAQTPPTDCPSFIPGTPLAAVNPAAPRILDLGGAQRVQITILGHSENRGYHPFLQSMLDQDPPLAGVRFVVENRWIGGHEAWRWATPGQRGHSAIDAMLRNRTSPLIVLGLFSNNVTFPITTPDASDPNFRRLGSDLRSITDHCHDRGNGATMVYLSSHRYKPSNFAPALHERAATEAMVRDSARRFVKAGPEQHDLHWCCFPDCYAADRAHTNPTGDRLMAEAWYNLLVRELRGCYSEPYGGATPGTGGVAPVIRPTGGFPTVGNAAFGVATSAARGGSSLAYLVGLRVDIGPVHVNPIVAFVAAASSTGDHALSLPIPSNTGLHGARVRVQLAAQDPAGGFLGFALSRGLELSLCR